MRPQRGSRAISTIGLNVQLMPSALASCAAICALRSMAFISQLQLNPNGIGNTVSYPCITSIPKIMGIFKRLSSTATFCTAFIFARDLMLNKPPTLPSLIFLPMSELDAWPVTISPEPGKFNCPIFSSMVIFFINASMKGFIFLSAGFRTVVVCPYTRWLTVNTAINNRVDFMFVFFCLY